MLAATQSCLKFLAELFQHVWFYYSYNTYHKFFFFEKRGGAEMKYTFHYNLVLSSERTKQAVQLSFFLLAFLGISCLFVES